MSENKNLIQRIDLPPKEEVPKTVTVPNATGMVTINMDEIKPNSVIVIKIEPIGMQQRIAATQQIAAVLRPMNKLIKDKNIAFIVMSTAESMEVLTEEDMNAGGWYKKEKSLIITP